MADKKHKKALDKLDQKFLEEFGEHIGDETIVEEDIGNAVKQYSELYGANKNLYRIAPHLISGLKPGLTRLLWSWWLYENRPQNIDPATLKKLRMVKVDARTAAAQLFHPHGTTALEASVGTLGQYWSNNIRLIDIQGNYGNMRGDRPAQGRYREAKLSKFTIDCFFSDFDSYCIPMKESYTGLEMEPLYLPAKYPYLLFNPQFSGIGWGMSANIPSFNVKEVLEATITLIKNPKAKIMLIPDIPTGCDIIDIGGFKDINETGISKLVCRATSEIDYANNCILFSSLPPDISTQQVITNMINLKNKKGFDELQDIKDSTKEGKVDLKVILTKNAKPDKVLQKLYDKVDGFKKTKPVIITVIDDFKPYTFGVRQFLLEWIDFRRDIVRPMYLRKLQKVLTDKETNEVLLYVFNEDNIDKTIEIAKTSKFRSETIDRLKKEFKINSVQAAGIADMHVYNFNKDSYQRYLDLQPKLEKELKEINDILDDPHGIDNIIIKQLQEGIERYGRDRVSKVVKVNDDGAENIPNTEHLIGITESGYIKKLKLGKDGSTSIGNIGKTASKITCLKVNNRENILTVDSTGMVAKISISAIPDMNYEDIGIELNKFFNVHGSIKAVLELPSMDILKVDNESFGLIIITKQGIAKKIVINEFKKITDSKCAIVLNDGDEVAAALWSLSTDKKDLLIYTNNGNGVRMHEKDIPVLSLGAKGKQILKIGNNESVHNATFIDTKKKFLFYLTANGYGKLTELKYLPMVEASKELVSLMNVSDNDYIIDIVTVNQSDKVMVYRKKSEPSLYNLTDVQISSRQSSGQRLIKTGSDTIVAYRIFC